MFVNIGHRVRVGESTETVANKRDTRELVRQFIRSLAWVFVMDTAARMRRHPVTLSFTRIAFECVRQRATQGLLHR